MFLQFVLYGQIPAQVSISRPVFLRADQAGHTLDVHKASVIPYKVFLCLKAANVFADDLFIDLEITFHSGNEGNTRIKKDVCICPSVIARVKYRKLRIYAIGLQFGNRTCQCCDINDVPWNIPEK